MFRHADGLSRGWEERSRVACWTTDRLGHRWWARYWRFRARPRQPTSESDRWAVCAGVEFSACSCGQPDPRGSLSFATLHTVKVGQVSRPESDSDETTNASAPPITNPNFHSSSNAYSDTHGNRDADADTNTHSDTNTHPHTNSDSDSDSDSDSNSCAGCYAQLQSCVRDRDGKL